MTSYILAYGVWYFVGLASFIWWETEDDDIRFDGLLVVGLLVAFCGPIAFLIGVVNSYLKKRRGTIIFKRREPKQ